MTKMDRMGGKCKSLESVLERFWFCPSRKQGRILSRFKDHVYRRQRFGLGSLGIRDWIGLDFGTRLGWGVHLDGYLFPIRSAPEARLLLHTHTHTHTHTGFESQEFFQTILSFEILTIVIVSRFRFDSHPMLLSNSKLHCCCCCCCCYCLTRSLVAWLWHLLSSSL